MKTKLRFLFTGVVVLLLLVGITGVALAATWTDQADYAPGSVVTVSGDNSDGAGFVAGETVLVEVSGPNGYATTCEAVADDAGAWSCQVTLAGDDTAIGDYAYTATGQTSGVSQGGAFTDTPQPTICWDGSSVTPPNKCPDPPPTEPPAPVTVNWDGNGANGGYCNNVDIFDDLDPGPGEQGWLFILTSPFDGSGSVLSFSFDDGTTSPPTVSGEFKGGGQGSYHYAVYTAAGAKLLSASATNGTDNSNLTVSHCELGSTTEATPPTVSKTADGTYDNTYTWDIDKDVDKTEIKQSTVDATLTYTVTMTPDEGTTSNVKVTGNITIVNPDGAVIDSITDTLSDGTVCTVADDWGSYECDLGALPEGDLTNTVTITWLEQTLSDGSYLAAGSAFFTTDPITFTKNDVDECVSVDDPIDADAPRTICVGDPEMSFTYTQDITGTPGTCTDFDNTATYTTNDTGATDDADATATLCVGADLTVSKDATPTFTRTYTWDISKDVTPQVVKQFGGTATFNYTVNAWQTGFTDSDWAVAGTITVTNPNDWEDVTLTDLTDAVPGDDCTVDPGPYEVLRSSYIEVGYSCTFADQPAYDTDITNTATATWDSATYYTPNSSDSGDATFQFATPTTLVNQVVTVTDTFNGGDPETLGTLTATDAEPWASATYKYSRTIPVPTWNCKSYDNTAKVIGDDDVVLDYDSETVRVCGPIKTGALTMGFWQNKNGQGIIKAGASTGGVCNSGTWLRQYAPFQDLSATANCGAVATYVTNVIKAANASGASMNAMLKAQMLATSLDVYFSDPALGGNKIGAPTPIGGVSVDLTKICKNIGGGCTVFENSSSVFGGSPKTVLEMLAYAASQSSPGGSSWYGQVKATQELAKDAFDAINNEKVFAP